MLAAYMLIASILFSGSTSSEQAGGSRTGPRMIRLFGQTIQVHPKSDERVRSTGALYTKPNNEYTESDLQRLGFTDDKPRVATGSKLRQARSQKPFDRHEGNRFVSHSENGPVYETNAQYVDRTMLYNRVRSRTRHQEDKALRQAILQQTGIMPHKNWSAELRDRKRRAREKPDEVFQFKHANGVLYDDPKGRTGQQYHKEIREKGNAASRKYYHTKKARRMQ